MGPPVFESAYGPGRQYYLDGAVAAASRRSVARLRPAPGAVPGAISKEILIRMWNLGYLIYRGPLLVEPEHANEPQLIREAIAAASGTDHAIFTDRLATAMLDPASRSTGVWSYLGAARFVEDYLDPDSRQTNGFRALLDAAMRNLDKEGCLGFMVAPELLTPMQRAKLAQIRAGG